jgi:hypothetical protein
LLTRLAASLADCLEAIVPNEDDGWAPHLWNLPRHSHVLLAAIQSDSAVKETDRREWSKAGSVGIQLKLSPDDLPPCAVIELLLGDRKRFSIKLERVVFRFEILDAELIDFHGCQGRRELFDLGAIRSVTLH